jgi:hypothetical protein
LSESNAVRCGCGYTYGQDLEDTLVLLDQQLHRGIGFAGGGALIVVFGIAAIAIMLVQPITSVRFLIFGVAGWLGGFTLTAKGIGMIVRARTSRRELVERSRIPVARVIDRGT